MPRLTDVIVVVNLPRRVLGLFPRTTDIQVPTAVATAQQSDTGELEEGGGMCHSDALAPLHHLASFVSRNDGGMLALGQLSSWRFLALLRPFRLTARGDGIPGIKPGTI